MRPEHNEVLKEPFESFGKTLGFNPAFIERVQAKRRQEMLVKRAIVSHETPIGLTPYQAKLKAIAERERVQILALKADKERRRRLAIDKLDAMKERIGSGEDVRFLAKDIIKAVAAVHHVRFDEVLGPGRDRAIVTVRDEAIRQVFELTKLSLLAIGRAFKRDHTSILHSLRKTAEDPANYRAARELNGN